MKKEKNPSNKPRIYGKKPNYKIAFDGVEYTKEEQIYYFSRLVDVLERMSKNK